MIIVDRSFHGNSLRLARLFQNKTLNDVAIELGVTRQYVSRWETGQAVPSKDQINSLCCALSVQPDFFNTYDTKQVGEHQFHFRKLRSTKVSTKNNTVALGEIFRRLAVLIETKIELPEVNFPSYEVHSPAEIEQAAEACRKHWLLGLGPIDNMTRVVENAGALVTNFKGVSSEVDALSITATRPLIVRNDAKESPGRLRFDLAHECGHFVMHEGQVTGDKQTESEANHFASAFLLPRSSFTADFPQMTRISWGLIREIKQHYRVSKACILYRARQLNRLTEQQYKGAIIRLKKHEGRQEKDDYLLGNKEQPELINNALTAIKDHFGLGLHELELELNLSEGCLLQVLGFYDSEISPLPAVNSRSNNVINLFNKPF